MSGTSPRPGPAPVIDASAIRQSARTVVIGRDARDADVVVMHPTVSRRHAALSWGAGGFLLADCGSSNGTFVDGRRIETPVQLRPGSVVDIGPFRYVHDDGHLLPVPDGSTAISLSGVHVEAPGGARRLTLLDDLSLEFPGGAITCVLGPSGCGKSTLLSLLSGRRTPTAGRVIIDGVDVHADFDRVKHRIAYVPQREALREELTVAEFLQYTARLRLPGDFTRDEAEALVLTLLERTGLADRVGTPIRMLSGGQRRRLSLVNELLGQPDVLLLDEVTSGLDEEAAHDIMRLVRELAMDSMTVVCVTHTVSAVEEYATRCLVLAPGGVPVYFGAPSEMAATLGVSSVHEIYAAARCAKRTWLPPARIGEVASAPIEARARAMPSARRVRRWWAQLRLQVARYAAVQVGDGRTIALALGQSVVIGLLLRLLFGTATLAPLQQSQLGFLIAISAFWFGCNAAAREIVKELELVRQEWSAGVRLSTIILSKVIVLTTLGTIQVLLLLTTVRGLGVQAETLSAFTAIGLTAVVSGLTLGLCISATSSTVDAASTALPILLIPQLLLSESMVRPLPTAAALLAKPVIAAYWLQRLVTSSITPAMPTPREAVVALAVQVLVATFGAGLLLRGRLRGR